MSLMHATSGKNILQWKKSKEQIAKSSSSLTVLNIQFSFSTPLTQAWLPDLRCHCWSSYSRRVSGGFTPTCLLSSAPPSISRLGRSSFWFINSKWNPSNRSLLYFTRKTLTASWMFSFMSPLFQCVSNFPSLCCRTRTLPVCGPALEPFAYILGIHQDACPSIGSAVLSRHPHYGTLGGNSQCQLCRTTCSTIQMVQRFRSSQNLSHDLQYLVLVLDTAQAKGSLLWRNLRHPSLRFKFLGLITASFEAILFAQFHFRPLQCNVLLSWDKLILTQYLQ